MSDIRDEVVGPAPAPSPCSTLWPAGFDSTITAFKTPLIFAHLDFDSCSTLDVAIHFNDHFRFD